MRLAGAARARSGVELQYRDEVVTEPLASVYAAAVGKDGNDIPLEFRMLRHGDGWKVRVIAPPEDGRANEAVLGLLAEQLDLPRRSLSLVSGHGGRDKVVRMAGISEAELERRLSS